MITLNVTEMDLLRCRFAVSPMWETREALRALAHPREAGVALPWLRRAAPRLSGLDLAPLFALLPRTGYTPDFLAPPPPGPLAVAEDELARIRASALEQVEQEIRWSLEGRTISPSLSARLADPVGALSLLADLLQSCWERLLAPDWPRVRDLLEGDIRYRAGRLAAGGMTAVLTQLHPSVAWRHGSVTVTSRHELRRDLAGEGLVFMPSLFQTGRVSVVLDPPWQPTLIYPARGPGRLAAHAPDAVRALAGVFGTARAAVLSDVAEPASTTELARRHGRSPGSVSAHLSALRAAGLVTARRVGRVVLYELTPLGHAVVGAAGE